MSLQSVIKRIANSDLDTNEETVKFHAVAPILKELGWDIFAEGSPNSKTVVEFEIPLNGISEKDKDKFPDIGLRKKEASSSFLAFVEVKGSSRSSSNDHKLDDHLDQISTYVIRSGTQIIALTNGKRWKLYCLVSGQAFDDSQFYEFYITPDNIDKVFKILRKFLLKAVLVNGKAVTEAKKILDRLKKDKELIELVKEVWKPAYDGMISDGSLTFLRDVVGYVTSDIAKKYGKQYSKKEIEKALREYKGLTGNTLTVSSAKKPKPKSSSGRKPRAPVPPRHIILYGQKITAKTSKRVFEATAIYFYKREGIQFIQKFENTRGGKVPFISRNNENERFRNIAESPIWYNAHGAAEVFVSKSYELIDVFGGSKGDLKIYHESGKLIKYDANGQPYLTEE